MTFDSINTQQVLSANVLSYIANGILFNDLILTATDYVHINHVARSDGRIVYDIYAPFSVDKITICEDLYIFGGKTVNQLLEFNFDSSMQSWIMDADLQLINPLNEISNDYLVLLVTLNSDDIIAFEGDNTSIQGLGNISSGIKYNDTAIGDISGAFVHKFGSTLKVYIPNAITSRQSEHKI